MSEAKKTGNPNLIAYAYGYATHYVTDVVGHPYVNQVVGAPWRLYWQRHHLVENFIDAYVWDRWHTSVSGAPAAAEPPLDNLVTVPNAMGAGAPATYARLHDHVNIGTAFVPDPVDKIVDDVAAKLNSLLANIGIAVKTEPAPPTNADALAWSQMFVRALHTTYDGINPENLKENYVLGGKPTSRPDGFPNAEDIAAAYGGFRLLLKVATEETIKDPQPPNITSDISAAMTKIYADIAANLGGIPPPPALPNGGAFSAKAIIDAIEKAFEWAAKVVAATIKASFDFIAATIGPALADSIKFALWLVAKALYALYRSFRDVLMLRSYAGPFTEQLAINMGGLPTASLWQSPGNPLKAQPQDPSTYPHEEIQAEREPVGSMYVPYVVPSTSPELPGLDFIAPYAGTMIPIPGGGFTMVPALPDAFIEGRAVDDMFAATGPQAANPPGSPIGFRDEPKNFGGAIANSILAIDLAMASMASTPTTPASFPNYNLDGDRTYAWPCWNVMRPPRRDPLDSNIVIVEQPLAPAAYPAKIATVIAVELQ